MVNCTDLCNQQTDLLSQITDQESVVENDQNELMALQAELMGVQMQIYAEGCDCSPTGTANGSAPTGREGPDQIDVVKQLLWALRWRRSKMKTGNNCG